MQKTLLLIIFLITNISIGQNNSFEDIEIKLYKTAIIEIDSLDMRDLKTRFKNVTSQLFVNLNEVITSETENQIILNFVLETKSIPSSSWNVRLISEFKDSKIRLRFYDLGNKYIPSGEYSPTWKEGSFFVTNNKRAVKNRRNEILNEWTNKVDLLLVEIENGLENPDINDDW